VLEIGTGSGYQAAVLAELAAEVYTVERHAELSEQAAETLSLLGYNNVQTTVGDGTLGWPEHAPYDGIIVTAGAPDVPESLKNQLADGGRLVVPVGTRPLQRCVCVRRHGNKFKSKELVSCVFVPLLGAEGWSPDSSANDWL
jgi:protein-L-isoaspartate(D-aspartate) O-methyltransferase